MAVKRIYYDANVLLTTKQCCEPKLNMGSSRSATLLFVFTAGDAVN